MTENHFVIGANWIIVCSCDLDTKGKVMKKYLSTLVSVSVLVATSAIAADLPTRKEPIAALPPAPLWTGFYAGLNAGYGFGTNSQSYTSSYGLFDPWRNFNSSAQLNYQTNFIGLGSALSGTSSVNQNGFLGGAQVGYNNQFMDKYVVGLEADIQGSNVRGYGASYGLGSTSATWTGNGRSSNGVGSTEVNAGLNWIGTVRARAGYLVTPTLLTYATAGLAYGDAWAKIQNQSLYVINDIANYVTGNQQFSGNGQNNQILVGYAAGGGVEWMMSQNWSLKSEAIYYNLGNLNATSSSFSPPMYSATDTSTIVYQNQTGTTGRTNVNYQGVMLRAGVNYHLKTDDLYAYKNYSEWFNPVSVGQEENKFSDDRIAIWNGFYAGLNAGYGFGTSPSAISSSYNALDQWTGKAPTGLYGRRTLVSEGSIAGLSSSLSGQTGASQSGFLAGGQIGYNRVVAKRFVTGLETDIQGTNFSSKNGSYGIGQSSIYDQLSGTSYDSNFYANSLGYTSVQAGVDWIGTIRGKIGYLLTPSWNIYGTGGLAYGGARAIVNKTASVIYSNEQTSNPSNLIYNGSQLVVGNGSNSEILFGYAAGAGMEYLLNDNWSMKTEAVYYNLGNMNVRTSSFSPPNIATNASYGNNYGIWYPQRMQYGTTSVNFQGIIARAGLNYHFDLGRSVPVVAKF